MEKQYYTIENLDHGWLERFMDMYNACSEDKHIVLYINSYGWELPVKDLMLHIINWEPDRFTMIGYRLASFWRTLFYMARCKRYILNHNALALLHSWSMDINYMGWWRVRWERNQVEKEIYDKYYQEEAPSFLTEDEKTKYNQWLDVYLDSNRMLSIIPECTILQ